MLETFEGLKYSQNISYQQRQSRECFILTLKNDLHSFSFNYIFYIGEPEESFQNGNRREMIIPTDTGKLGNEINVLLELKGNTEGMFPSREHKRKSLFAGVCSGV